MIDEFGGLLATQHDESAASLAFHFHVCRAPTLDRLGCRDEFGGFCESAGGKRRCRATKLALLDPFIRVAAAESLGLSRGARASQVVDAEQDFARRTRKCHPHSHGKKSPIFVPSFYRALASPRDSLMGYFSDPGSPARSVAHPVCRQRSNLWLSEVWLTSVSLLLASLSGPFGPQVVWGLWGRPFVIAGASILIATLISARNCQLIVVRRMPHQVPYRKRLISLIIG